MALKSEVSKINDLILLALNILANFSLPAQLSNKHFSTPFEDILVLVAKSFRVH